MFQFCKFTHRFRVVPAKSKDFTRQLLQTIAVPLVNRKYYITKICPQPASHTLAYFDTEVPNPTGEFDPKLDAVFALFEHIAVHDVTTDGNSPQSELDRL